MRLLLLIAVLLGVAACATPGPEPNQSEAAQEMKSGGDESLVHDDRAERSEGTENSVTTNAAKTPDAVIPQSAAADEEIICKRVKPTGSRIPRKVCLTRSEMLLRERADQDMLRKALKGARPSE